MYWSDTELSELQGSSVVSKIGKAAADEAFTKTLLPLVRKYADLFGIYAADFKARNLKGLFLPIAHRMATLIMAYAFDLETEENAEPDEDGFVSDDEGNLFKGMVPLADMLNANGTKANVCIGSWHERRRSLDISIGKAVSWRHRSDDDGSLRHSKRPGDFQ